MELARRAGVPRTTISAIEGRRLIPSVNAALLLSRALGCPVEDLFGNSASSSRADSIPVWAWEPREGLCRYWEAEVGGRRWRYPVESLTANAFPHDGVWPAGSTQGSVRESDSNVAETTLVLACCDPAAGLLAAEYARTSGLRLIVLQRGGVQGLDLIRRGVVHVAGLHQSTPDQPERNAQLVRARLGSGYRLTRVAEWQEGLAISSPSKSRSPRTVARTVRRWALRESGSAARDCLDTLAPQAVGRTVFSHQAVAEAVRSGWADAGVCVQLSAEEAGLSFLPIRLEALDFCHAASLQKDPRLQALLRVLRSRSYRRMVGELPGYDSRETGETQVA